MDTNGESCDGGGSEGEEEGEQQHAPHHLTAASFVFIGANIKTGKSSLRSKPAVKKVRGALKKSSPFRGCVSDPGSALICFSWIRIRIDSSGSKGKEIYQN
jgi:hypothetical protein